MNSFVAALPMYDWPERRDEVDAEWTSIRDRLRARGIDAPQHLARRNADLPPVPGGIRDAAGEVIAPDPATLPPNEFDLPTLWRHPDLLLGQTCWGPMLSTGLEDRVVVLAQPSYRGFAGGEGPLYSSAVVMRAGDSTPSVAPPDGRSPLLPLNLIHGTSLAFNDWHSMSGMLGLKTDLEAAGQGLHIFGDLVETGAHRESVRAVADGRADVATIDCRSWAYARRYEPDAAAKLSVVGWTARRIGLPFVAPKELEPAIIDGLRGALSDV